MKKRFSALLCAAVMTGMCMCPAELPAAVTAYAVDFDMNGTLLRQYNGTDTHVVIPDGVTEIGSLAFSMNSTMEEITIPDSVETIDTAAFMGCSALRSVTLPPNVDVLENAVFAYCGMLTEFTGHDRLKSIGISAFAGCALREFTCGEALESIGDRAFFQCGSLEEIYLNDNITYIAPDAFLYTPLAEKQTDENGMVIYNVKLLLQYQGNDVWLRLPEGLRMIMTDAIVRRNVVILTCPSTLRTIAMDSIQSCPNLFCIEMNDGLETIGDNVFSTCPLLKTAVIPASVHTIGKQKNCTLTDIYGTPGTAAETFAKENGITFHDAAELIVEGPDNSIIYGTDTWSIRNGAADFGDTYYLTDAARAEVLSHMASGQEWLDEPFTGACFGLTVTALLAKAGILPPAKIQSGAETLSEITPTGDVLSVINYYHFTQQTAQMSALAAESKTDAQVLYQTIQAAKAVSHGGAPFLISLSLPIGGHAYIGYGQEDGAWEFEGQTYDGRILVWDPNFPTAPNEKTYIYYDSATLAYCIPYYKSYVGAGEIGSLKRICSDTELLNLYPYPFPQTALTGDADCDGDLTLKDAVLLAKVIGNVGGAALPAEGRANADCNQNGGIDPGDLTVLLRMLAGIK